MNDYLSRNTAMQSVNVSILQMLWLLLEDYEDTCSNTCIKFILNVTTNLSQDIMF